MKLTTCGVKGGEVYELLVTVAIGEVSKIETREGVKLIGHITKPQYGKIMVSRDGQEFELKAQGWNPLSKS